MNKKSGTLVMKFGGTSVGTPEALRQVMEIVHTAQREWQQVVVVSSALNGVTDGLILSARQAASGDLQKFTDTMEMITERHQTALSMLVQSEPAAQTTWQEMQNLIESCANLVQAIAVLGEATPRALDAVVGLGERLVVRLIAAALRDEGLAATALDATRLIVSNDQFQSAIPDMTATSEKTRATLPALLQQGEIPIVTGFIAATPQGIPTTLGRGGSDYSAAILAVALDAAEVWIWTDVDGVMSADPRLVADAHTIPELSYREVSELAYFGAKVLHPRTIQPVVEAGIRLRVLNTFHPNHGGTLISQRMLDPENGAIIKAVTAIRGVQLITVAGRGMLGVPGVAARILGAVATTGATVPLITEASSEQSLCFAVPAEVSAAVLTVLHESLAGDLEKRNIERVSASEEVVIVTAVCPQMQHRLGVAGKIFSALGDSAVNVLAIAHGSSDVSISLVVSERDLPVTMKALHALTWNGDHRAIQQNG